MSLLSPGHTACSPLCLPKAEPQQWGLGQGLGNPVITSVSWDPTSLQAQGAGGMCSVYVCVCASYM